jgi:hypothetical protein
VFVFICLLKLGVKEKETRYGRESGFLDTRCFEGESWGLEFEFWEECTCYDYYKKRRLQGPAISFTLI